MGIVEEEADESIFWMEMLTEGEFLREEFLREELLTSLLNEANEILSMVVASIKTSRQQTAESSP